MFVQNGERIIICIITCLISVNWIFVGSHMYEQWWITNSGERERESVLLMQFINIKQFLGTEISKMGMMSNLRKTKNVCTWSYFSL